MSVTQQSSRLKRQESSSVSDANLTGNIKSVATGLKPTKENRKKFDIDLAYGKVHEEKIISMLQDKKIEVKTERGMWSKTGNIAIEFESYGKPSGINATESDYWFHNLAIDDEVYCTLVFSTPMLKNIVEKLDDHKVVKGGDNWASKMFLVNLSKLFSTDTLKLFKEKINGKDASN
jgi:hypothetical protein